MKIERIRIKNFRSIKDQEIPVTPILGLIGANNAGKSNILKAINLVLGERFPIPHSITRKDFYNEDPSNNIEIEIFFDSCFVSYDKECNAVVFKTIYDNGSDNWETELHAIEKYKYEYQKYKMKGDTRDQIAVIYIPASRDFTKQLQGSSEWELFGKVKKQFNYLFPENRKSELEYKFKEIKDLLMEAEKF